MNWWDIFKWGYATNIEEYDSSEEDIDIEITIDIGDSNGNS